MAKKKKVSMDFILAKLRNFSEIHRLNENKRFFKSQTPFIKKQMGKIQLSSTMES